MIVGKGLSTVVDVGAKLECMEGGTGSDRERRMCAQLFIILALKVETCRWRGNGKAGERFFSFPSTREILQFV